MTNEFIFRSIRYYKERKMPKHAEFLDGRDYIYNCAWSHPSNTNLPLKPKRKKKAKITLSSALSLHLLIVAAGGAGTEEDASCSLCILMSPFRSTFLPPYHSP